MPTSSKVLDEARDLVKKRLAELDDERKRLERALAELGGKAAARGPGRPRGGKASSGGKAATKAAGGSRRRRRRRGGTRADQAVSLVEKNPGISASEIAKAMKIKPNYLYRVLSELEKEGRVKKQGRKYVPGAGK
jgi:transposase-like protein